MRRLPSQGHLRLCLDYTPETGVFVWKVEPRGNRPVIGKIAGTMRKTGYRFIGVPSFGQLGAHRLAWVYVHGSVPDGMEVDHIDCDPENNAIANLRLATSSQQKQNKRVQSNNRSGLKGAFYHAGRKVMKWRSQIKVDGRYVFLGYFNTAEEAHVAYGRAALTYYGNFARAA